MAIYKSASLKKKDFVFVWNSDIIEYDKEKDLPFDYFLRKPFNLTFKFEDIIINS